MKISGYKIKQAIKAFEQLSEDLDLKATTVPIGHDDRTNFAEKSAVFTANFNKMQRIQVKLADLKKIQLVYNLTVRVKEDQTLADAINETAIYSKILSKLTAILTQVTNAEINVTANSKLKHPSTLAPSGLPPIHDEPFISKSELQSAIRQCKIDVTRTKNLVGYGNSIEIDMEVDENLFNDRIWSGIEDL